MRFYIIFNVSFSLKLYDLRLIFYEILKKTFLFIFLRPICDLSISLYSFIFLSQTKESII